MRKTDVRQYNLGGKFFAPGPANRDERAALIAEYAPLVKFLANRMAMRVPPSVSLDDLISAGLMGLLDAIDKFDSARDVQFKTYAEFRIKGSILDELRSLDWVSRSTRRQIHDLERAIVSVQERLGRPADDEEIAQELGVNLEEFHRILCKARGVDLLSLDEFIAGSAGDSGENGKTYKSLIQGEDDPAANLMAGELRDVAASAIQTLTEKEQLVISLYYYDELTLKEIGEVLNLTESRISQIHTKAIIKLRAKLRLYWSKP